MKQAVTDLASGIYLIFYLAPDGTKEEVFFFNSGNLKLIIQDTNMRIEITFMGNGHTDADTILFNSESLADAKISNSISGATGDVLWGLRTKGDEAERLEQSVKGGCDFVVFSPEKTPLDLLKFEKLGKIIEFGDSVSDNLLRASNEVPADGVFLNVSWNKGDSLSWQNLLSFRRFADMLTKPLIVSVPLDISGKELVVLWETGVSGVVVPVSEKFKELMEEVNKLTFPPQRKVSKREAILPHLSPNVFTKPEEEEEEDE